MKLRNKKTGEKGYFCFANWNDPVLIIMDRNGVQLAKYNSIAELNEEWEDYEEPKQWWYLDVDGEVCEINEEDDMGKDMKSIGNYFETEEEAEKAVEKLKAWKRLKDKGFRFCGGDDACISYKTDIENWSMQDLQDFNTLFGGEE